MTIDLLKVRVFNHYPIGVGNYQSSFKVMIRGVGWNHETS